MHNTVEKQIVLVKVSFDMFPEILDILKLLPSNYSASIRGVVASYQLFCGIFVLEINKSIMDEIGIQYLDECFPIINIIVEYDDTNGFVSFKELRYIANVDINTLDHYTFDGFDEFSKRMLKQLCLM